MPRRILETVNLNGLDYFGRKAHISFSHNPTGGWLWNHHKCSNIVIGPELLSHKKRRIALQYNGSALNIFEHLGVLRWCGFEDVIIQSDPWPPYFGRSKEYFDILFDNSEEVDGDFGWFTLKEKVKFEYGKGRYTEIIPNKNKTLHLRVICDYRGLGRGELSLKLPEHKDILIDLLEVYSQGWTSFLFYPSWLASKLHLWLHHQEVIWPQHCGQDTLILFLKHRMLDLLGALAFMHPTKMLSGTVISFCSGHKGDIGAIEKVKDNVTLLE